MSKNLKDSLDVFATNIRGVLEGLASHPDILGHYLMMIEILGKCYTDKDCCAVILAKIDGDLAILSVNTPEINAAKIVDEANDYLLNKIMDGAPDKSMFN